MSIKSPLATFFVILMCVFPRFSWAAQPEPSCEALRRSEKVLKFQSFLNMEQASAPTIWQHKLSDYPVIVIDHKVSSQCFALIRGGIALEVFRLREATEQREYDTYDWYKSTYGHIDQEYVGLREIADINEIQNAMIQHFGNSSSYLDAEKPLIGRVETEFSVQVHEALHAFVQESANRWTSPTPPPIDDEDHGPGCYMKNEDVKKIHKAEFEAAMGMLRNLDNLVELKRFAAEFVLQRERRYMAAGDLVWKGWSGEEEKASCRQLETQFEYGEGIPQFVEVGTLLDLGMATRIDVITQWEKTFEFFYNGNKAGTRPLHSYYYTGAIQVLAIRAVLKDKFLNFSSKLMKERSGKSITEHLIEVLGISK